MTAAGFELGIGIGSALAEASSWLGETDAPADANAGGSGRASGGSTGFAPPALIIATPAVSRVKRATAAASAAHVTFESERGDAPRREIAAAPSRPACAASRAPFMARAL
ncbi:MAG TPA: hypothetical protein VLT33_36515, partial [Labilithrix sp.]|nr:hypothetical protein [Labilithrix sp.]